MGKKLLTGEFNTALECALAREIAREQSPERGRPVIVLVGSNMLALYLRRRLAEIGPPLWNVRFFTCAELARKIALPRLSSKNLRPLPPGGKFLLLKKIAQEQSAGYFAPVYDLPGFVNTTDVAICDLKEAGIPPAALDAIKSPKLTAFKKIYQSYENSLAELQLYDDADILSAASAQLAQSPPAAMAEAAFIAYGFYDLTELQRRLALGMSNAARSAAVLVPAAQATANKYAQALIDWLVKNKFSRETVDSAAKSATARLFDAPSAGVRDVGKFKIISAPGESSEVREIVRQILEYARDGIAFNDIAILLRNPVPYAQMLSDELDALQIPHFIAGGKPLSETRHAKSFALLMSILTGDLKRADVMQFAHYAPIDLERVICTTPKTTDWDLLTIRAGIVANEDWHRLERFRTSETDPDAARLRAACESLRTFIEIIFDARTRFAPLTKWSELTSVACDCYSHLMVPSDETERVLLAVRRLAELDSLGVPATHDDFCAAVSDLLQAQSTPSQGFQRGRVFIGRLFESRGLSFRAVIIPGMCEKNFPAAGRQDPILLDADRARLSANTGSYLPLKLRRTDEERMLFALALDTGIERVTLTFPRLDLTEGRQRLPSYFLTRLAEAVDGQRYDYSTLERFPGFKRTALAQFDEPVGETEYNLNKIRTLAAAAPDKILYLAKTSSTFASGIAAERARWHVRTFTEYDGLAPEARVEFSGHVLSATRIEDYAKCPFQFFLRRVLGLEVIEEPEKLIQLDELTRGSLIHEILCAAYSKCWRKGQAVTAELLETELRTAAERTLRAHESRFPALTWQIDTTGIIADLSVLARLDVDECSASGARPTCFELAFGSHENEESSDEVSPPLSITCGDKTYQFRGRIDRVDELPDGTLRVIDYKSGKVPERKKTNFLCGGRAIQLPVYLLAAQAALGKKVSCAKYWYATSRGHFASIGMTGEDFHERQEDFKTIIAIADDCIERGIFIKTPGDEQCRYCDLSDACGVNAELIYEFKKDDAAISALLEMREIE